MAKRKARDRYAPPVIRGTRKTVDREELVATLTLRAAKAAKDADKLAKLPGADRIPQQSYRRGMAYAFQQAAKLVAEE